jgi:hypothetical protein
MQKGKFAARVLKKSSLVWILNITMYIAAKRTITISEPYIFLCPIAGNKK